MGSKAAELHDYAHVGIGIRLFANSKRQLIPADGELFVVAFSSS